MAAGSGLRRNVPTPQCGAALKPGCGQSGRKGVVGDVRREISNEVWHLRLTVGTAAVSSNV